MTMNRQLLFACATMLYALLPGTELGAQQSSAASVGSPAQSSATTQADSASVVALMERLHAAMTAGDSATIMALLAPDAVILESGGVETRAEYQSHHLP